MFTTWPLGGSYAPVIHMRTRVQKQLLLPPSEISLLRESLEGAEAVGGGVIKQCCLGICYYGGRSLYSSGSYLWNNQHEIYGKCTGRSKKKTLRSRNDYWWHLHSLFNWRREEVLVKATEEATGLIFFVFYTFITAAFVLYSALMQLFTDVCQIKYG